MIFKSDNTAPAHPAILEAVVKANYMYRDAYGKDDLCTQAKQQFCTIMEKDVDVFFVGTGSAANAIALAAATPPYGMIFSAEDAHVQTDEANCVEGLTGGAKLKSLCSHHGKIVGIDYLLNEIITAVALRPHVAKPSALTLSQSTEWGTVYTPAEINLLCDTAKQHGLKTHMDGARFANALAHLRVHPKKITWKAGVDILSFGATKNGAMQAEAIVVFDRHLAAEIDYRIKRAGHLISKQWFWAAQFLAYFHDDLWLHLAKHANTMAKKLALVFEKQAIEIVNRVEANEVFIKMPKEIADKLQDIGVGFYSWGPETNECYRWVTSWYTEEKEIMDLDSLLTSLLK